MRLLLRRVLSLSGGLAVITALMLALSFAGVASAAPMQPSVAPRLSQVCGHARVGYARCLAIRNNSVRQQPQACQSVPVRSVGCFALGASGSTLVGPRPGPKCASNPTFGYTPCDLASAYHLRTAAGGDNQTVAIVDAFDDPNAESDLATYRAEFKLPPCTTANGCFRKVNQLGQQSNYPVTDPNWSEEISLDLDMASAICLHCHILLVEATDNSFLNLGASVNEAAALGATTISNSYGGTEFSGETTDTDFNHPGIAITASTGDSGFGVQFPASSPFVTAVGGTTLVPAGNARGWTETAWSGAGSGCSAFEAQPSWQTSVSNITANCGARAVADVSATADPDTGVDVYDSFGVPGWLVFGGTSVASPIIATVYALAGNASSVTYGSFPYSHTSSLNDVTSGSNGACGNDLCTAGIGWDGPTGLGTPNGIGGF